MSRKQSILTDDMEHCYLCERPAECVHHIFFGPNRQVSEQEGFTVPLCNSCHNMSGYGVHFNRESDLFLKRLAQRVYEKEHTREEFIGLIGRSYL